jgi:hypothetical protein
MLNCIHAECNTLSDPAGPAGPAGPALPFEQLDIEKAITVIAKENEIKFFILPVFRLKILLLIGT